MPDEFIWTMKGILGVVIIIIAIYIAIMFLKLENAVIKGGTEELEKSVVETIENNVNEIEF